MAPSMPRFSTCGSERKETRMLQRIRAVVVVLAMGAGALALSPTAHAAAKAPDISKVDISPGPPIVVFDNAVTATFTFTTKGAGKAELQLKAPGDMSVGTPVELTSSSHGLWTKWTGKKAFDAKSIGRWSYLAIAHGDGENSTKGAFDVKKALDTKIVDFDANPDHVAKGSRIRVSGQLLAEGKAYGGQSVTVTFREKGTDAYRHITKVTTAGNGAFAASVTAEATGWWRAEFDGNAVARGSVSDTDRVDVRAGAKSSRIIRFDASPSRWTRATGSSSAASCRRTAGRGSAGSVWPSRSGPTAPTAGSTSPVT